MPWEILANMTQVSDVVTGPLVLDTVGGVISSKPSLRTKQLDDFYQERLLKIQEEFIKTENSARTFRN
jgi:hypothetical protein